jgi:hypothetical protein
MVDRKVSDRLENKNSAVIIIALSCSCSEVENSQLPPLLCLFHRKLLVNNGESGISRKEEKG